MQMNITKTFAALSFLASSALAQGNLDVGAMAVPANLDPGANVPVSVWITNRSSKAIDATTITGLYLSTNTTITKSDTPLGRFTTGKLAPNQTVKYDVRINVPLNIGVGTCYVGAIADVDGTYSESNENDNTAAKKTNCRGLPDLFVKSATVPVKLSRGGTFLASAVIENRGGVSAIGANIGVFLSQNASYGSGDVRLATRAAHVSSGSTTSISTTFTIPALQPIQNYYILIVADYDTRIVESVEGNNTRARLIEVWAEGSTRSFGTSCAGSGGMSVHSVKPRDGATYPRIGYGIQFDVSKGKIFAPAMCILGTSSRNWGKIALPLPLRDIGGGLCQLYVSMDLTIPFATGATGFGGTYFRVPNKLEFVGMTIYSQALVIDDGSNLLGLTMSNAHRTTFGHEN